MADKSVEENREMYAELSRFGPYSTLAPGNRGGPKSRYFAAAFDAALLPLIRDDPEPIRLLDFGCGSGIFSEHGYQRETNPGRDAKKGRNRGR